MGLHSLGFWTAPCLQDGILVDVRLTQASPGSLPRGSVVKNPPSSVGDTGLTPGLGRCPEEGNGNPLQCSCLGNSVDRGAWRAHSPWGLQRVGQGLTIGWVDYSGKTIVSTWVLPQTDGWGLNRGLFIVKGPDDIREEREIRECVISVKSEKTIWMTWRSTNTFAHLFVSIGYWIWESLYKNHSLRNPVSSPLLASSSPYSAIGC